MKVVMTSKQFVSKLKHIANDLNTYYSNNYPYNLGYYHSNKKWSWDCWNLVKSLIWGWHEEKKVGYYAKPNTSTGLGDWDGRTILKHCSDVSSNFVNLTIGEYLINGDYTHAGTYVGDHYINHKVCNVIECTPAFGGGVVWSYCDAYGNRMEYKGSQKRSNSPWTQHGKLPWIDYTEEKKEEDIEVKSTITAWQILAREDGFSVYPDGIFGEASEAVAKTGQSRKKYTKHLTMMIQGTIGATPDGVFGKNTETALKAFQTANNIGADGICGIKTWKKILGIN